MPSAAMASAVVAIALMAMMASLLAPARAATAVPTAMPTHGAAAVGGSSTLATFNLTYTYGLPPEDAYETVLLVSALGGLANRGGPRLYTYYMRGIDEMWLDYARTNNTWPDVAAATLQPVASLTDLLTVFSDVFDGVVLYDPMVPATSNIAQTIAGVENLLPVCNRPGDPQSLYAQLIAGGPKLPVKVNLTGMFNGNVTGSAKNDAYRWAIDQYLVTPERADGRYLSYTVDWFWTTVSGKTGSFSDNTVSNTDYVVSKKGFVFDLSAWADEAPNDDPHQPLGTDLATMQLMLEAAYNQTGGASMNVIQGFVPWAFKYVAPAGKHQGVATEWQTSQVVTAYNALVSADACCVGGMANGALYAHFPLGTRLGGKQNRAPSQASLTESGMLRAGARAGSLPCVAAGHYAAFYVGDYDSAAWIYGNLRDKWDDPARGQVPLGWALDPNLAERFPLGFHYVFESLSATDRVTTGDSGAGYVNPTQLLEPRKFSGLPSAQATWTKWCETWYARFGITWTGFLINGAAGDLSAASQSMYTPFSWDGMTDQTGYSPNTTANPSLQGNTPVFQEWDIPGGDIDKAVQTIISQVRAKKGDTTFSVFRSVLQTATYHKQIVDELAQQAPDIKVVEPLALGYLARAYLGGNNDDRVLYIDDTLPTTAAPGSSTPVTFTVRNNGWNALAAATVQMQVQLLDSGGKMVSTVQGTVDADVQPNMDGTYSATLVVPPTQGQYSVKYQLCRTSALQPAGCFDQRGNIAWTAGLTVASI